MNLVSENSLGRTQTLLLLLALTPFGTCHAEQAVDWNAVNDGLAAKASGAIAELSMDDFCAAYGMALRTQRLPNGYEGEQAATLVKAEAKRRKLKMQDARIKAEEVRLGDSDCHLYAAWGPASRRNRSVGAWGADVQHIYGRTYIYTRNGIIKSWQD